jgi:hypothetical protein
MTPRGRDAIGDDDYDDREGRKAMKTSRTLKLDNATLDRKVIALRARLGATRGLLRELAARPDPSATIPTNGGDPSRFVSLVVQNRGGFGVLYALDASGQLWERHTVFDQTSKAITEEWWTKCGMNRRQA